MTTRLGLHKFQPDARQNCKLCGIGPAARHDEQMDELRPLDPNLARAAIKVANAAIEMDDWRDWRATHSASDVAAGENEYNRVKSRYEAYAAAFTELVRKAKK